MSLPSRPNPASQQRRFALAAVAAGGHTPIVVAPEIEPRIVGQDVYDPVYRWLPTGERLVFASAGKLFVAEFSGSGAPSVRPIVHSVSAQIPPGDWITYTSDGDAVILYQAAPGGAASLLINPLDGSAPSVVQLPRQLQYRSIVATQEGTAWRPNGHDYYVVMDDPAKGSTKVIAIDPRTLDYHVVYETAGALRVLRQPRHASSLVVIQEDLHHGPAIAAISVEHRSVRTIVAPRMSLDPPLSTVTWLTTIAPRFDGSLQSVRTAVFRPTNTEAASRQPAVVVVYPGLLSEVGKRFLGSTPAGIPLLAFVAAGYTVVVPDIPLSPRGQKGNPAMELADAVIPQIYAAIAEGVVDPSRLAVMGQSWGGYATLALVAQSNLFRAAISIDVAASDMLGAWGRMEPEGPPFTWWPEDSARMGAPPWEDLNRYLLNSPFARVERIRTPLLLIHGERDREFPAAESGKMFAALRRLGRRAEYALYHGEGHSVSQWSLPNALDCSRRVLAFLEQHLNR